MKHKKKIFQLRNHLTEIKRISGLVKNFSGSRGLTKEILFEITLCIDEHVTNIILDDLVRVLEPVACDVVGEFNARGGIGIAVEARYQR